MANFLTDLLRGVSQASNQWPAAYVQRQQQQEQKQQRQENKETALRTEALQRLGLVQQYVDAGNPQLAQAVFEQTIQGPWAKYVPPDVLQRYEIAAPTLNALSANRNGGSLATASTAAAAKPAARILGVFPPAQEKSKSMMVGSTDRGVVTQNPDGSWSYQGLGFTPPKEVQTVDQETGIIYFQDGSQDFAKPEMLDVINKGRTGGIAGIDWTRGLYMTKDQRVHSMGLQPVTGLTPELGDKANRIMMEGFNKVSDAGNPLPAGAVEKMVRMGLSNLGITPQQQDEMWNQYSPVYSQFSYKVPWTEQEKGEHDNSVLAQNTINKMMGLLKDPQVAGMFGRFNGSVTKFLSWSSGQKNLSENQKRFLQDLNNIKDLAYLRKRSGAAIQPAEQAFYDRLLGTETMALPALSTGLDNMFDLEQLKIQSLYQSGLMRKDPQNWANLMGNIPLLHKVYLANPDSIPIETPESLIHGAE